MVRVAFILLVSAYGSLAQEKPAYRIFTKDGKAGTFEMLMQEAGRADVVFFGELHNNSMAHWLELQVMKELFLRKGFVTLGMEMLEADDQLVLDEYMEGLIDEKQFLKEVKLWDNYLTDYRPLLEFARENKLRVTATNIPRRYANVVYKKGTDALSTLTPESKKWIAPLPIPIDLTLPGYKSMMDQMGRHEPIGSAENLACSQAIKDATMAHFIIKNNTRPFLHVNGAYHSQNFEGIVWYVRQSDKKAKIVTLQLVEQKDINQLEENNKGLGDFIICVPNDMTKTY